MSRYQRQDRFFKKAKDQEYAARSVYKLEEIQRRYTLLKKGARIVDLGCAPGSWLQFLEKQIGKKGATVGYDIVPVSVGTSKNVRAFVADVAELTADRVRGDLATLVADLKNRTAAATPPPPEPIPDAFRKKVDDEPEAPAPEEPEVAEPEPVHVPPNLRIDGLISDMAPKLTGIRDADQAKSVALTTHALRLAEELVVEGGFFVAKLFQGRDTDEFVQDIKRVFKDVKLLKPEATRDGSREVFVVARGRRALG